MLEKNYPVCNKRVRAVNEKQMDVNWYVHETLSQRHRDYLKLKQMNAMSQ